MKERIRNYFRDLSGLHGVSGSEQAVVRYMKEKLEPLVDELIVDTSGNVIAIKHGTSPGPKLMIAAHSDEIGFCVKNILDNGFILYDKIGSASDKVMEGRKVWIKENIPGVIGIKPGHLQTPEESRKVKTTKECYIDAGCSSRSEVEALGIKIGDPIAYHSDFMEMANTDLICTKAVDDRINCAILIELFDQLKDADVAGTIVGAITVQEEIGMRGAVMVGNAVDPDYAIVIDTIPAGDTPDVNTLRDLPVYLGKGPACAVASGIMYGILFSIAHPKVKQAIEDAAEKTGVNIQYTSLVGDGYATDAERLNISGTGIPLATLAVPRRYSHSPVELFNINDAVDSLKVLKNIIHANGDIDLSFI